MKTRTYLPAALAALTSVVLPRVSWAENEVGYIEKFALAANREAVLGELVPGSEDYYFFHALHFQNTRNEAKLADILAQWEKRSPNENARRRIILNREALLDYDATPQQTLAYLKTRLNVLHNHVQEARDKKPNLPTALDAALLARGVFQSDALTNDGGLQTLTQEALEALVIAKTPLNDQQRRGLLGKIQRPDVPGLVELILTELRSKDNGGFGAFAIHRALLPEQLDALAKAHAALTTTDVFVYTKLRKLAPSEDVDIAFDATEREAWLTRAWDYVKTLPPAFNTLKAHVLYRRLDHDRAKGVYDQARFVEYLKLPRQLGYVNPKYLERVTEKQPACDLNANLAEPLLYNRPIADDEALVREFFLHIFNTTAAANLGDIGADMINAYTDYVRDTWLKPVLAEALIVGGHGSPERWASLLTPQAFQKLKERVDIEFPATNAPQFAPGDDVAFDVTLKNTPKLIVKIYELNALNFFQTQKRQLNTDLNLDGLVANSEQTHSLESGPFKRERRTFKFADLKGRRGAWIVEFIGGGRSSRALVRVGQWQVVQQTGPAGDMLTVLDEKKEPVKDAVVWLDGRKYTPDEKRGGAIVVPFTAQPGPRALVLSDPAGTFATLTQFENHAEAYVLDAQFHIEREQLLATRTATLAVRTSLLLGQTYLDPALITEPRLVVTSTTHEGISTTKEIKDLKLGSGAVLAQALNVPDRLATLSVTLVGKVKALSDGAERDVSASHTWTLNGMDKTEATNDGHLSKFGGDYVYELLGKNGEPVAENQIVFTFKHRDFSRAQTVALKTDDKGRVALGALAGIKSFHAKSPNGRDARWELDDFERTWASVIHTGAAQPVRVPAPPRIATMAVRLAELPQDWLAREVSLLEMRAGTPVADAAAKIKISGAFLTVEGLAPGDYSLRIRGEARDIAIKVSGGKASNGWYLGASRNLQAKAEAPLQIASAANDAEFITVKLANASPFTRVHIAATRFEPGRGIFQGLAGFARFGAAEGNPARLPNLYSAGREIGDEYRYILERRYTKTFPGNMLPRPGLLLNPWSTRDTDLNEQKQQGGQAAGTTRGGRGEARRQAAPELAAVDPQGVPGGAAADTNLDFLASSAPVLLNLVPDADGTVKIDRKALGDRQHVQIYAEDLTNAVWRSFALPEPATKFADKRLLTNLDPAKPFTQKKEVTVLEQGRTLTLGDILTSELETYDSLGGVHSLLTTLSGEPKLAQFAWLLQWPKLKDDEKRAKYSEFACHELNFFLARKDPAFFDKVIKPYLANKKDKTFMDDFLIGADLAKYREPSEYVKLNVVECALLGTRVGAEAGNVSRNLRELWELIPPNPELADRLFETALRGRELEEESEKAGEGGGAGRGFKSERSKALAESAAKMDGAVRFAPADAARPAPGSPAPAKPMAAVAGAAPANGRAGGVEQLALGALRAGKDRAATGLAFDAEEMDKLADLKQLSDEAVVEEFRKNPALEKKAGAALSRRGMLAGGVTAGFGVNAPDANKLWAAQSEGFAEDFAYFGRDAGLEARANYRALYRQLGITKEWAENNYYKLRITEQVAQLVPVNAFWRDYAAWVAGGSKGSFVSPHIAESSRNFTEMMLALAVLDLPFDAPKHNTKTEGNQFTLTAGGPVIAFHKEIKADAAAAANPVQGQLLVSQSFFRHGDRHRMEGNEKFEKYVSEEFLTGAVYGANVVVTNPTSSPVKAEVLLQIPQGALSVLASKATDSKRVRLEPYTTKTFEYYFYFPAVNAAAAKFAHFPVNVSVAGGVAGGAKPFTFNVVAKLTQVDKASWDYVSQYGSEAEVFAFLEQNNLASLNFPRVAWRCKDAAFYKKLAAFLHAHHVWDDTIYSYALLHNDPAALREWIKRRDDFVKQCGPWLATKLVLLDPIERRTYEHLEYTPLINQRAHRLGSDWRVANPAIRGQYQNYLEILAHKPQLDGPDSLAVSYYLFLQDRVEEGLARFRGVNAAALPTRVQHDYLRCYAGLYEGNLAEARGIAAGYADFPLTRWRNAFTNVTVQLDEIEGKQTKPEKGDKPDREGDLQQLTATEPAFDFKVENKNVALTWRNLGDVTVNYYLMDPEFSFSSNPFVSEDAGRFGIIKPSKTAKVELPKGKDALDVALPAEFAKANVLVEIIGAGQRKTQAYHANTLKLAVTENYGRLETRDSANDKPVSRAYVKVYARLKNGTVRFFKDGYTDLRGRFDYASLNGAAAAPQPVAASPAPANGLDYQMLKPSELNEVEKLALLILSDTNGATTREVNPPRE